MNNKLVSLTMLPCLWKDEALSGKYIKYLCGLNDDQQYKHQEILDIQKLLSNLKLTAKEDYEGFIYSYVIPQLNKEFDLIKVTKDICINIELKSQLISIEEIEGQLQQNKHFLKMLNKEKNYFFTYISDTNQLYQLTEEGLQEQSLDKLEEVLLGTVAEVIDLDEIFMPKNILVSPLNSPDEFLQGKYLLTEHQNNIKQWIFEYLQIKQIDRFVGVTGGPGTGKTLLIYDLAKQLQEDKKILFVHSGILCDGHHYLNEKLDNVKIISAKDLRLREIKDVDIVIVDEAHRLYEEIVLKIERWVKKAKATCIFSYDIGQKLSRAEDIRRSSDIIDQLCDKHIYKLTNKIRTNKELALFITCLRDLSKYRKEYRFKNVQIIFEPNKRVAVKTAKKLQKEDGYTYITYTSSFYDAALDYQKSDLNTHTVIGQEFDKVCMIIDDNFYYDGNYLKGKRHPNPDYIFEKLLYQGLTRVRSKLAIIITDKEILSRVLLMFE